MSRSERRRARQNVRNFVPRKSNSMNKWIIVALAVIAVVFFIGTTIIQRGA